MKRKNDNKLFNIFLRHFFFLTFWQSETRRRYNKTRHCLSKESLLNFIYFISFLFAFRSFDHSVLFNIYLNSIKSVSEKRKQQKGVGVEVDIRKYSTYFVFVMFFIYFLTQSHLYLFYISVFTLSERNKFNASFALSANQKNLIEIYLCFFYMFLAIFLYFLEFNEWFEVFSLVLFYFFL